MDRASWCFVFYLEKRDTLTPATDCSGNKDLTPSRSPLKRREVAMDGASWCFVFKLAKSDTHAPAPDCSGNPFAFSFKKQKIVTESGEEMMT